MFEGPKPDNSPPPSPISPSNLGNDPESDAHDERVHKCASDLVQNIVAELNHGSFTPNERQAVYLANEFSGMMRELVYLEIARRSDPDNLLIVTEHSVALPYEGPLGVWERADNSFLWEINHAQLLTYLTSSVRVQLDMGEQLDAAIKVGCLQVIAKVSEPTNKTIRPAGTDEWLSLEEAIKKLEAPADLAAYFPSAIQTHIDRGKISPDCERNVTTDSHSELARVLTREHQLRLASCIGEVNLDEAPELNAYTLRSAKEVWDAAKDKHDLDNPLTHKNIAFLAAREAIESLQRHGNAKPSLDDCVAWHKKQIESWQGLLKNFQRDQAPPHIQASCNIRLEFHSYATDGIQKFEKFLKATLALS